MLSEGFVNDNGLPLRLARFGNLNKAVSKQLKMSAADKKRLASLCEAALERNYTSFLRDNKRAFESSIQWTHNDVFARTAEVLLLPFLDVLQSSGADLAKLLGADAKLMEESCAEDRKALGLKLQRVDTAKEVLSGL